MEFSGGERSFLGVAPNKTTERTCPCCKAKMKRVHSYRTQRSKDAYCENKRVNVIIKSDVIIAQQSPYLL
jgi:hypothetical protein